MSELHILVVADSKTGKMRVAGMEEAPVDSQEWVWDDPDWRHPTDEEVDQVMAAEHALTQAIESAGLLA